ncbi:MAG TPA: nuclear transport factor 2 family protein [Thermoleophilaceae bacterium]|nr:nuclear transport factor 2 family protein [Thermoleophilaceae bacterium]
MPVTDSDLAHVQRAFVEFNERYDALRDGGAAAYHAEFYAPDSVIEHVDSFPSAGRYEGLDGYLEWFGDSYGEYRDVTWEILDLEAVGDRVLALVRVSGKPPDDDVRLEVALGITYEMRAGKIGHVRVYVGHERARDAASSGG